MTPEERQMITGLFDRMRGVQVEKDSEADALIQGQVRSQPLAPYMLVQSVLVQEHALQAADARIQELEARVRDLEAQSAPGQPQKSGGFLGGLFGGNTPARPAAQPMPMQRPAASVPSFGAVARPGGAWGQAGGPGAGQPGQPMQQPAAGGGFLKSAMATAAGVAGGMLLADSIRGMMGGNSGQAQAAQPTPAETADPGAGYADEDLSGGYAAEEDTGGGWGNEEI